MGMAASQARLLSITARLADNELRSQTINNAKMRLATQSSQASENYVSALNNANLMFSNYDANGTAKMQVLDFNALTAYSSYNNQYGLVNTSGQLLVSESEAALFDRANGNVNAYLKSHGLEYTTTYFDQLGNVVNEEYPAPFDVISPDQMREMYEAYGSYGSSVETERFRAAYNNFSTLDNELKVASKEIFQDILLSGKNNPQMKLPEGGYAFEYPAGNINDVLNYYQKAFNNPNNTYSIETLKKIGLTDLGAEILEEMINAAGSENVDGTINGTIKTRESYTVEEKDNTKTHTLVLEDATILIVENYNSETKAWELTSVSGQRYNDETDAWESNALERTDAEDPKDNYSFKYDTNAKNAVDVINSLYEIKNDGTSSVELYFAQEKDKNGNLIVTSRERYSDTEAFKVALNSHIDDMMSLIITNENLFDVGSLSMAVLKKNETGELDSIGVNLSKILKSGKTYGELLNQYKTARDEYLGFIEVNYDPTIAGESELEALLSNGKIKTKDLLDTDKMLKILKQNNIKYTNNYQTVIKEFIIDQMIAEFGEPKYAWVDETDKTNKGNADAKAQWYTNLFNRMKQGYKILENGLASSSEWMEFALQSGIVTMEQVDKSFNWVSLDYKTCSNITEETENKELVAKAEAEYNRAMKDIDAKDNIYDMELKNIDTEHTALQTEYDSIKGVISKNIERTFKFNQNG